MTPWRVGAGAAPMVHKQFCFADNSFQCLSFFAQGLLLSAPKWFQYKNDLLGTGLKSGSSSRLTGTCCPCRITQQKVCQNFLLVSGRVLHCCVFGAVLHLVCAFIYTFIQTDSAGDAGTGLRLVHGRAEDRSLSANHFPFSVS